MQQRKMQFLVAYSERNLQLKGQGLHISHSLPDWLIGDWRMAAKGLGFKINTCSEQGSQIRGRVREGGSDLLPLIESSGFAMKSSAHLWRIQIYIN